MKLRREERPILALSLVPWMNLALWTAYALAARFTLGHFPHPMTENCPPFLYRFEPSLAVTPFVFLGLFAIFWFVVFWQARKHGIWSVWRSLVVCLMGVCATIVVVACDPVRFVEWFID